jgi:hypothetical protein
LLRAYAVNVRNIAVGDALSVSATVWPLPVSRHVAP